MTAITRCVCALLLAPVSIAGWAQGDSSRSGDADVATLVLVGTRVTFAVDVATAGSSRSHQLVLEVVLKPSTLTRYRQDLRQNPDAVYTLVPERGTRASVLSAPGAEFEAELYRGVASQGGSRLDRKTDVRVSRVIHAHALGSEPGPQRWIAFGGAGETFLVRRVDSPTIGDFVAQVDRYPLSASDGEFGLEMPEAPRANSVVGAARVLRVFRSAPDDVVAR